MQRTSVDEVVLDFMDRRRVFTVDPDYFPMNRMQEIVEYLHAHDQKFGALSLSPSMAIFFDCFSVLITDPAMPFLPMSGYGPYERGHALDIFLKDKDGRESLSVVWPGF
jgi:alpha-glucosidase